MALDLQEDADAIFLDSGFEEDVVYTPSGGAAKTIKAIVAREGIKEDSAGRQAMRTLGIEIDISTHPTTGQDVVTVGEDTVSVARRVGEAATTMIVAGVVTNDAGMWRLRLR